MAELKIPSDSVEDIGGAVRCEVVMSYENQNDRSTLFTFTKEQIEEGRYKKHIHKAFVEDESVSVPEVSV